MPFFDPIRIGAAGAADTGFTVDRSLRFNDDDTAYLNRTPSSDPTSGQKVTFSIWFKICTLGTVRTLFANLGGGNGLIIQVDANDELYIYDFSAATNGWQITSDFKLRDVSAWYHLVVAIDTTQATDSNRAKVYINGELKSLSAWSVGGGAQRYPAQNVTLDFNANGDGLAIGGRVSNGQEWDGYLAEVHVIDGQQLTQASFAETNALTGQWNPIDTSGLTFGTNGFRLKFADNSGTSATTLGKDTSGNSNNFTPNNFSVAAGAGNDSLEDTPTNNFATLNPLSLINSGGTFSNGNLDFTADSNYSTRAGTFSIKNGKWYWEITVTNYGGDQLHGIVYGTNPDGDFYPGSDSNQDVFGIGWYGEGTGTLYGAVPDGSSTGQTISAGTSALTGYTTNDVLGFASDIPNGTLAFYKNGTLLYTLTGIGSHDWVPVVNGYGTSSTSTINFGQRPFTHTQPSGFKTLCSANLPDPTILLPNKHFDTLLYTGSSSSSLYNVTGLEFQPDWVWGKSRNDVIGHILFDAVRGEDRQLEANLSDAEVLRSSAAYRFLSNGFAVSTVGNLNNPVNYVAWNWNAGDTDGKTYTVTVVDDSGNKFRFDGFGTSAVTLDLAEGGTYIFNYPSGHPFRFSTTSDGTHGGGSEYTTGVTHNSSTQVTIVVAASAPTLYYYCSSHSGMGGQVNTNSTLGSSNFDGSVQTTAKVNATAGFSILTYTGTGSTATVGHGLGVAPEVILLKDRNATGAWKVLHKEAVSGSYEYFKNVLYLNSNDTFTGTGNSYPWGNTEPTSSVFSLGNIGSESNRSGSISSRNYVAYCFSGVEGYSKFGKYTGNGSTDGPFVYTGFRPSFILWKPSTQASTDWVILDNKRDTFNVADAYLLANSSAAEGDLDLMDFLSNGFKLRQVSGNNESGQTIIYLAFAESPFKNARAR